MERSPDLEGICNGDGKKKGLDVVQSKSEEKQIMINHCRTSLWHASVVLYVLLKRTISGFDLGATLSDQSAKVPRELMTLAAKFNTLTPPSSAVIRSLDTLIIHQYSDTELLDIATVRL